MPQIFYLDRFGLVSNEILTFSCRPNDESLLSILAGHIAVDPLEIRCPGLHADPPLHPDEFHVREDAFPDLESGRPLYSNTLY